MEYYNGLYSDVREDVKILCDQHVASKCPVNTGNGCKTKRHICPAVREGTDVALTLFDIVCNCQASHSLWVVAGGYASYVMGHTSTYTDVDLFVRCFGQLKPQSFSAGNVLVEVKGNVVSFLISGLVFQVVQVPFSVAIDRPLNVDILDMFAFHIVTNFDLPVTRVALKYHFLPSTYTYVLDVSSIDMKLECVDYLRVAKYEQRKVAHTHQPPSLKSLCLFSLMKLKE